MPILYFPPFLNTHDTLWKYLMFFHYWLHILFLTYKSSNDKIFDISKVIAQRQTLILLPSPLFSGLSNYLNLLYARTVQLLRLRQWYIDR